MIDLILSDDSQQFQELTRTFSQKEIAPRAQHLDHEGLFPDDILKEAAEIGLTNVLLPEDLGGMGLTLNDTCVIVEELATACPGVAMNVVSNLLALSPLLVSGNKDLLAHGADAISSQIFAGYAVSLAKYVRKGAQFEITGEKLTVMNGEHGAWIVVCATESSSSQRTLFLLNRDEIQFVGRFPRFGLKSADIAAVDVIGTTVSADRIIGKEGAAPEVQEEAQRINAPLVAACAAAIVRAALEHSLRYSKERQAFGQPISSFQAVAFMMSDMARSYQAARLMTWRAARLYDTGIADKLSGPAARDYALNVAMAAATDAVQIFGGYGYSKEYPVEKLMRDAKLLQMLQHQDSFETRVSLGRELTTVR